MARLKGIKELNEVISAQLKPFGIESASLGAEFCYNNIEETVDYALTETVVDEWFNEFVADTFGYIVEYTFIISLLHEIGHYYTYDNLSDKMYYKTRKQKNKIEKRLQKIKNEEEEKELHFKYFGLYDEIIATQWAVDFAKKHPKKIRKMWRKIYPAIIEFYTINGITK